MYTGERERGTQEEEKAGENGGQSAGGHLEPAAEERGEEGGGREDCSERDCELKTSELHQRRFFPFKGSAAGEREDKKTRKGERTKEKEERNFGRDKGHTNY